MTLVRKGIVCVGEQPAGEIVETANGYSFTYAEPYLGDPSAQPISLTLPLRSTPHASASLHPFFAGLLAEGALAAIQCQSLHIDERDLFGRLLATTRDTIGAVTVHPHPGNDPTGVDGPPA